MRSDVYAVPNRNCWLAVLTLEAILKAVDVSRLSQTLEPLRSTPLSISSRSIHHLLILTRSRSATSTGRSIDLLFALRPKSGRGIDPLFVFAGRCTSKTAADHFVFVGGGLPGVLEVACWSKTSPVSSICL